MSSHRWEHQRAGDASRSGCLTCACERDDRGPIPLFRSPFEQAFKHADPGCRPIANRVVPRNPENARRAVRTCAEGPKGLARRIAPRDRCPACGYGTSVMEQIRFNADAQLLEQLEPDAPRAPRRTGRRTGGSP